MKLCQNGNRVSFNRKGQEGNAKSRNYKSSRSAIAAYNIVAYLTKTVTPGGGEVNWGNEALPKWKQGFFQLQRSGRVSEELQKKS
jgi:hypothetical protein